MPSLLGARKLERSFAKTNQLYQTRLSDYEIILCRVLTTNLQNDRVYYKTQSLV